MNKQLLILGFLFVSVTGQQVIPIISLGINVNLTELEPQIQIYQDAFECLTSGLSMEEILQSFPDIFNSTIYSILDPNYIISYGGAPMYEGIMRSENGTKIIREVFKNPQILLDIFSSQATNWEPYTSNGGDSTLIITNYILSITVPWLDERYRNFTSEILVSATLAAVEQLEDVDVIGGIQTMIDILDQATSSAGGLLGLVGLLQDDVVQQAVEATLTQAGIDTDIPALAELTADFIEEVQSQLGVETEELVQFIKKVFEDVKEQLD